MNTNIFSNALNDLNWHLFQEKCSITCNEAWNKVEDAQNTLKYTFAEKATPLLFSLAVKISAIVREIMAKVGGLGFDLSHGISLLNEANVHPITKLVKSTFFVFQIGTLISSIQNRIKEHREAKELGDKQEILLANLDTVTLASNYLFIPEAIVDLLQGFLVTVPPMILQAVAGCSIVAAFFSIADIIQSGVSHKATSDLLGELQRSRHLAFLVKHAAKFPSSVDKEEKYKKLTEVELKIKFKEIKNNLKSDPAKLKQLIHFLQSANTTFIRELESKIIKNPKIMKTHFRIIIRKEEGVIAAGLDASGKAIPARINQKIFGEMSKTSIEKHAKIVKKLKSQLKKKCRFNFISIFTKIMGLAPIIMMTALALGASCHPLAPIAAAFAGVVAVLTLANLCYNFYHTHQFTKKMELLISPTS